MRKTDSKKLLSGLLVLCMLFSMLPLSIFAVTYPADGEDGKCTKTYTLTAANAKETGSTVAVNYTYVTTADTVYTILSDTDPITLTPDGVVLVETLPSTTTVTIGGKELIATVAKSTAGGVDVVKVTLPAVEAEYDITSPTMTIDTSTLFTDAEEPDPYELSVKITGTPKVGNKLDAEVTVSDTAIQYDTKWYRGEDSEGDKWDQIGTGTSYTLIDKDAHNYIKVVVTGTGDYTDLTDEAISEQIAAANEQITITSVAIDPFEGVEVGTKLTAKLNDGIVDDNGVTYKWERWSIDKEEAEGTTEWETITGATSNTYTVTTDDEHCRIRVTATADANSADYKGGPVTSDPVGPVPYVVYTLTVKTVGTGTVEVTNANGGGVITSGSKVDRGVILNVKATAGDGYELYSVEVTDTYATNDPQVEYLDGVYKFTMRAYNTTITATFIEEPDKVAEGVEATTTPVSQGNTVPEVDEAAIDANKNISADEKAAVKAAAEKTMVNVGEETAATLKAAAVEQIESYVAKFAKSNDPTAVKKSIKAEMEKKLGRAIEIADDEEIVLVAETSFESKPTSFPSNAKTYKVDIGPVITIKAKPSNQPDFIPVELDREEYTGSFEKPVAVTIGVPGKLVEKADSAGRLWVKHAHSNLNEQKTLSDDTLVVEVPNFSEFIVSDAKQSNGGSTGGGGGGGGGSSSSSSTTINVGSTSNGTVTVSPKNAKKGDTVTITAKPNSGYVVGTVTVTDKNGNTVNVTMNADGTCSFVMPEATPVTVKVEFVKETPTTPTTPSVNNPFYDVPSGAYYYDAVMWAIENNITAGMTATSFGPNEPCTRAQIVTFLWRAAGSPRATGSNPFADVSATEYYYDAVQWAVANGITAGTTETTFSPSATCTRAQAVSFLYRANNSPAASGSNSFTDLASGAYYTSAVQWAVANGITAGTSNTTFSPDDNCTRAQIVSFLYRDRVD